MNYAKRVLMGVGVVVIAAMMVALLAPKAAHGLVAALVQVTNTTANPVPTDDPAAEPFSWESSGSGTAINYVIHGEMFTVPTTTDDGKIVRRLVLESASVSCRNLDAPSSGVRIVWQGATTTTNTEYFFPAAAGPDPSRIVSSWLVRIYVDPGGSFSMNLADFETLGTCSFSATGHYVTQ